jgi:hypothetical protein
MPSLSQVLILSTLFLAGALSLPVAEPQPGINGSPGFSLTQDSKREAEAAPGGVHGGFSRGGKREAEAEPEARNTLESIPIASFKRSADEAELEQREAAPGGVHGGFGRGKREAEPVAGDGYHYGASYSGGLTRGSKREAEPVAGDGYHYGASYSGGLTRD